MHRYRHKSEPCRQVPTQVAVQLGLYQFFEYLKQKHMLGSSTPSEWRAAAVVFDKYTGHDDDDDEDDGFAGRYHTR